MLRIAITGGIGSGKTAVTDYLASMGYRIIDADVMAHDITAPGGKAIPSIIDAFGEEYINADGSMNRDKIRELVYRDSAALSKLEACTTKVIIRDVEELINRSEMERAEVVFLAAPLLFEQGGQADSYDAVWLVVADTEIRIARVQKRDGLNREEILRIISKQLNDEKKLALASDVIYNNGALKELHNRVDELITKYLKKY